MPKKFRGENSKAVEARARKSAQKEAEDERKQRQLEDELWKEDDKHVLKKLQRKEDKEKKRVEQQERKKETQRIADEELASIRSSTSKSSSGAAASKVTRADIDAHQQQVAAATAATCRGRDDVICVDDLPLEENVNRLSVDGVDARTVDDAIRVLRSDADAGDPVDIHPEKRMKAAYLSFEERRLPQLKSENPNLRLSQLKQMLKKDWNKSPDNPLNQRVAAAARDHD